MNRYEFPVPRAPLAIAAVAMSVLTFALTVVVPIQLAPVGQEAGVLASSDIVKLAPIDVVFSPARIDTVGDCLPQAVVEDDDVVVLKTGQQG